MSIFWTFSTCIGDGSGQFWWTLKYKRQLLDVIQSGLAVRNITRLDVIWMKSSSSGVSFYRSARSRAVSSQLFLHETIDYSVSNCFMNIKVKTNIINYETSFRHANPSAAFVSGRLLRYKNKNKISSKSCYLLMSASQWPCKHVLTGDYFPNPDNWDSHYYRTCYDKAAYIISQAWLWSDS